MVEVKKKIVEQQQQLDAPPAQREELYSKDRNRVSAGAVKLSRGNARDHDRTMSCRHETMSVRACDNGVRNTVPQVRKEWFEGMEVSIEFGLGEGNQIKRS